MTTMLSKEPRIRVPHHPARMIDFERLRKEQAEFVRRRRRDRVLRRIMWTSVAFLAAIVIWKSWEAL